MRSLILMKCTNMLRFSIQCSQIEQHDLITIMAVPIWIMRPMMERFDSVFPNWATGHHSQWQSWRGESARNHSCLCSCSIWNPRARCGHWLWWSALICLDFQSRAPELRNTILSSQWQRRYERAGNLPPRQRERISRLMELVVDGAPGQSTSLPARALSVSAPHSLQEMGNEAIFIELPQPVLASESATSLPAHMQTGTHFLHCVRRVARHVARLGPSLPGLAVPTALEMRQRGGLPLHRSCLRGFVLRVVAQERWQSGHLQRLQPCHQGVEKAPLLALLHCSARGGHDHGPGHAGLQDLRGGWRGRGAVRKPHGDAGKNLVPLQYYINIKQTFINMKKNGWLHPLSA